MRWTYALGCILFIFALGEPAPGSDGFTEQRIDLGGVWRFRLDPANKGLEEGWMLVENWAGKEGVLSADVPGPWELLPEGAGFDGVAWYSTSFLLPPEAGGRAAALCFSSVNYACTVYLNGKEAGRHEGGYSPFIVWIPESSAGREISLVLRVVDPGRRPADGMTLDAVPHAKESWYYNFGGITGDVTLRLLPKVYIEDLFPLLTAPAGMEGSGRNRVLFNLANRGKEPVEASFRLTLREASSQDEKTLILEGRMEVPPGAAEKEVDLSNAPLRAWSPKEPVLYEVGLEITSSEGRHSLCRLTGARLFELKPEGFYLNGERIYLKGILYQAYYPGTLYRPPSDEWVEREVRDILECGFNLVRAHLRPLPEGFLDACDRSGLLVMAEPAIGWIYEESDALERRLSRSVESLVRRDRHHPSIVWWGMLNELSGVAYPLAPELMARARLLDPSRLITDDSGAWGGAGQYFAPFEDRPREYLDYHVYIPYPLSVQAREYLGALGDGKRPAFVSEFGFGGMDDLEGTAAFFKDNPFLEDASEYAQMLRGAERSMAGTVLKDVFPSLRDVIRAAEGIHGESALEIGSLLKANRKLCGYCFTQYQDVSWELSAGIVNVDGSRKPSFEALKRLNEMGDAPEEEEAFQTFEVPKTLPAGEGRIFLFRTPPAVKTALEGRQPLASIDDEVRLLGGRGVVLTGDNLSLIKKENIKPYVRLMRYVRGGGTLVFLNPPRLDNAFAPRNMNYDQEGFVPDLPVPIHFRRARGSFVGHFQFVNPGSNFWLGLDHGPVVLGRPFGRVLPHYNHLPLGVEGAQILAGGYDAYGLFTGAGLLSVPFGEGRILISDFQILPNLGDDDVAEYLLICLVEYALARSREMDDTALTDDRPLPGTAAEEEIAYALFDHRRYLALGERLSIQRMDGTRHRYNFYPDLFQWNRIRIRGLDRLIEGRIPEALEELRSIDDVMNEKLKEWIDLEKKLDLRLSQYQRTGAADIPLRQAGRYYHAALAALWDGEKIRFNDALDILVKAFKALPEAQKK